MNLYLTYEFETDYGRQRKIRNSNVKNMYISIRFNAISSTT